MQITVNIPDELVSQLACNESELPRMVLEDAALGAYCRDAISRDDHQRLLGFETGNDLDGLLKQRGIEHGSYRGQDLTEDLKSLQRLGIRATID
jgi:predicted HTH domain antitoxin